MLANFDAPSREECTASRGVSNTPQQALTLLNDPTFVDASRAFAAWLLAGASNSDRARLEAAFRKNLGRPPRSREVTSLLRFLEGQRAHYRQEAEEAEKLSRGGLAENAAATSRVELAAWTQVCRVVLNLHETVTRY